MAKYAMTPTTTDVFPKMGDSEADVENVSGQPSPYMQRVGRKGPTAPDLGGQNKSNRTPVEIDAESGQRLDAELAKGLTLAAERRLSVRRTVEAGTSVSQRAYEDHVFGLNLPGRDRQ
jgi:hypothetical protein